MTRVVHKTSLQRTVRFSASTKTTEEVELGMALGSPKVLPEHLPPEAINVDAPDSLVTQHGYITPAFPGSPWWWWGQYGYITHAFSGSP